MVKSSGWIWLLIIAGACTIIDGSGLYKSTDNVTILDIDNIEYILPTR